MDPNIVLLFYLSAHYDSKVSFRVINVDTFLPYTWKLFHSSATSSWVTRSIGEIKIGKTSVAVQSTSHWWKLPQCHIIWYMWYYTIVNRAVKMIWFTRKQNSLSLQVQGCSSSGGARGQVPVYMFRTDSQLCRLRNWTPVMQRGDWLHNGTSGSPTQMLVTIYPNTQSDTIPLRNQTDCIDPLCNRPIPLRSQLYRRVAQLDRRIKSPQDAICGWATALKHAASTIYLFRNYMKHNKFYSLPDPDSTVVKLKVS